MSLSFVVNVWYGIINNEVRGSDNFVGKRDEWEFGKEGPEQVKCVPKTAASTRTNKSWPPSV